MDSVRILLDLNRGIGDRMRVSIVPGENDDGGGVLCWKGTMLCV